MFTKYRGTDVHWDTFWVIYYWFGNPILVPTLSECVNKLGSFCMTPLARRRWQISIHTDGMTPCLICASDMCDQLNIYLLTLFSYATWLIGIVNAILSKSLPKLELVFTYLYLFYDASLFTLRSRHSSSVASNGDNRLRKIYVTYCSGRRSRINNENERKVYTVFASRSRGWAASNC